jgi:hypothetical protein
MRCIPTAVPSPLPTRSSNGRSGRRRRKFDQSTFGDAFVNHTKKNVEAAVQKWSEAIEDQIRRVVPNRWNDISQILKLAAVPR